MNRDRRPLPAAPRARRLGQCVLALCLAALSLVLAPGGAIAAEPCPNEQARGESNVNAVTGEPYSTQLPDCSCSHQLVSPSDSGANSGVRRGVALLRESVSASALPLQPDVLTGGDHAPQLGSALDVQAVGAVLFWISNARCRRGRARCRADGSLNVFLSERGSSGWGTTDLTTSSVVRQTDGSSVAGAPDGSNGAARRLSRRVACAGPHRPAALPLRTCRRPQEVLNAAQSHIQSARRESSASASAHGAQPRTPSSSLTGVEFDTVPPFVFNAALLRRWDYLHQTKRRSVLAASTTATDCYSWSDARGAKRAARATRTQRTRATSNRHCLPARDDAGWKGDLQGRKPATPTTGS